jgi:hypothetical protein
VVLLFGCMCMVIGASVVACVFPSRWVYVCLLDARRDRVESKCKKRDVPSVPPRSGPRMREYGECEQAVAIGMAIEHEASLTTRSARLSSDVVLAGDVTITRDYGRRSRTRNTRRTDLCSANSP